MSTPTLEEALASHGWTDAQYGIGLYSHPEYGTIVVDMNAWDPSIENGAALIPSINSASDGCIAFIDNYEEIDTLIIEYIDKYKNVLNKEVVAGFGPHFSEHVSKARFLSEAEYEHHSASYGSLRAAKTFDDNYFGNVIKHGEFSVTLDIGGGTEIDCNNVDLDRIPTVGETVLIAFEKGRGKVSEAALPRKSRRP